MTYWDIVINAMSRLHRNSIADVDSMTLTEYYCLIHARNEQDLYQEYTNHRQAFLSREVNATKNVGTKNKPKEEYIFKRFDEFFDYEDAQKKLRNFETETKKNKENQVSQKELAERVAEMNKKKSKK